MRNVLSHTDSSQEGRECIHHSGNDCLEDKQLQREQSPYCSSGMQPVQAFRHICVCMSMHHIGRLAIGFELLTYVFLSGITKVNAP